MGKISKAGAVALLINVLSALTLIATIGWIIVIVFFGRSSVWGNLDFNPYHIDYRFTLFFWTLRLIAASFGLYFLYLLSGIVKGQTLQKYRRFYARIAFLNTLILAFFIPLILQVASVFIFSFLRIRPMGILQLIIFAGSLLLSLRYLYRQKVKTPLMVIPGLIVLGFGMGIILFFVFAFESELRPKYYGTFPLNDPKGRYIINYDGDYWVTYYVPESSCELHYDSRTQTDKEVCTVRWVKKGNTSIRESPRHLDEFIDIPVRLSGSFTPIHWPIPPGNLHRSFCVVGGTQKLCNPSTGPGYWHSAPLTITSVNAID